MKYLNEIVCGDCNHLISDLDDESVGLCVTSPPYALQRTGQSSTGAVMYSGISEQKFPEWTVGWMRALKPKLKPDASVFIVIRPHVRDGQISDYVLRTRLAVREDGWKECEELIWYKPDAPPLGSVYRPRRAYESILWYSLTGKPYSDLTACGKKSSRTGGFVGSERFGEGKISAKGQVKELKEGISRISDVITAPIGTLPKGVMHPAMYPSGIADMLIQTFSRQGDAVLDPFMGSGQTALSAVSFGRNFFGFDVDQTYVDLAKNRVKTFQDALQPKNYQNAAQRLRCICPNGHETTVQWASFRQGVRCKYCKGNAKLTYEFVKDQFEAAGCKLLEESYVNSLTPMRFTCPCGKEATVRWGDFQQGRRRCKECGYENCRGANSPRWNPDREKVRSAYLYGRKAHDALRSTLKHLGIRKNSKCFAILGYTQQELRERIESHPNWEKVKDGDWTLDHIFPIKAFVDHNVADIRLINSLAR